MENSKLKTAYKIAYKIARELKKLSPYDFSDIEVYNENYLKQWTIQIFNGDISGFLDIVLQSDKTAHIAIDLVNYKYSA